MDARNSDVGIKSSYSLKILSPVGVFRFSSFPHAKRLSDLHRKKIGLYWNNKARGEVALERVKELLSERYEGITYEWFETPISVEATKEWFEKVKKSGVDAVIASTGD